MTRILVNHLTRMTKPYICVAGLDQESNEHVRPVLARAQLDTSLLASNGGAFELGAIVDLGNVFDVSNAPEVEDRRFNKAVAKRERTLTASAFWKAIDAVASSDLNEIFGEELEETSRTFSTAEAKGSHSLGCYRPQSKPTVDIDSYAGKQKVYAYMMWNGRMRKISVADLRLADENFAPSASKVKALKTLLVSAPDVLLSVGLGRAFAVGGSPEKRHWLQINNIYVAQEPLWG